MITYNAHIDMLHVASFYGSLKVKHIPKKKNLISNIKIEIPLGSIMQFVLLFFLLHFLFLFSFQSKTKTNIKTAIYSLNEKCELIIHIHNASLHS